MAWSSSDRRSRLPKNWATLRARVLKRDGYTCTINGCANPANEVDHIRPGDDHAMSNLRAICSDCHKRKSSTEGGQARQRQIAEQRTQIRRRTARFDRREKHPGEL